ncbi:hypothetical protein RN001_005221 [Aquatica leii]|uniref:P-type domain-containing protein n=1 Tax=Aquatica leii TaxID=1421715 RepID=A0AAN7Q0W0_9COLE|nr:hypothetical protein RN001_005221 [Aquatica leii]
MEIPKSFVELQNEDPDRQEEPIKKRGLTFSDKQSCVMFIFFIFASLTIPIIIYFITINITVEQDINYSCSVDDSYKVPCGRPNISRAECIQINGCYDDFKLSCYHFMPSKYNYYINEDGAIYDTLQSDTPFGNGTIPQLKLSILELDSNVVKIILYAPSLSYTSNTVQNKTYIVRKEERMLGVEVFRQDIDQLILSTLRGPLIASEHYWEWTVHLICEHLIGLGELILPANKTVTKVIYKNKNDHTTLPNFLGYSNGSFYGILFEHDGPLEITIFPSKLIILKSLAGDRIAINIFTGPTPKDIIQQMRNNTALTLPYWTLGAHICRDGNTTIESALQEFTEFYQIQKDIHYASDCVHENLYNMLYQIKHEHNLTDLIYLLQQNKTRFLMSIPPQVLKINKHLYDAAVELNILYKNADGEDLNRTYQNQEAVFPDYTHTSIEVWFEEVKFNLPTNRIDGFVLKDNWPDEDNYIFKDLDYKFPYMTEDLNNSLSKTIPWNASSFGISPQPHILHHNSYGSMQLSAFKNSMNYEFIATSSFEGDVFEPISIQNVNISWTNLKKSVTTTLYNSMFGRFMTSAPVCGSTNAYNKKTHDELCLRWYITTATLPVLRISSDFPRRDPSNLQTNFTKDTVIRAIQNRYMLLPYYFTTLSMGDPLVRPMIYSFYNDNVTWSLDEQYMLGDALLVTQPYLPALTMLTIYLPPAVKVWYEYWGGDVYNKTGWINFNIVKNDWVMFIAAGCIVPVRHHKSTKVGEYSSNDSFGLAIALNCTTTECDAKGLLRLDSAQLSFSANITGVFISNITEAKTDIGCELTEPNHPKYIENLVIYGITGFAVYSNFTTVDLCNVTESMLYIPYFLV